MRKWNKLLALVLAMVMVFGLTATAFAAEKDADEDTAPVTDTEPAEGEDAEEPAEGEDAEAPAEGEDAEEPAEGEDAEAPAEGEDAAPAEDDNAEEPTAAPAAVTFSDVEEGRWFYEFVMKMAAAGIVNGNPDGTFNPSGNVKWGEALKMVVVLVTGEEKDKVEGGSWASGYIAFAKAEGIIAEDAEIDHNAAITRVEMCELLAKALKVAASEKESIFSDTDNGYVMALVELGIISEAEKFNPDNNLSRAELCKILATIPEDLNAAEPAEGEDAAEPTEDEDATEPTEGEDENAAEPETEGEGETTEPETEGESDTTAEPETEGEGEADDKTEE